MKTTTKLMTSLASVALLAGSANAALTSQLGVLDLTANGGINPATGFAWEAGDTYRLIFASSTGIDATSADISVYNAHVDGLATSAGFDSVDWFAFASTPTTDARDNTGITGVKAESFWLMDGTTKVANDYADFYDGHTSAEAIDISETGGSPLDNGNFTSLWTGTAPDGTGQNNDELGNADGTSLLGLWGSAASASQWVTRFGGQDQDGAGNTADGVYAIYGVSDVLTVVPEPTTTALLGLGGLALILRRRK